MIYSSRKAETIQMFIREWMNELNFSFSKKFSVTAALLSWNGTDHKIYYTGNLKQNQYNL